MGKNIIKKIGKRLLSIVAALAMVFTMSGVTAVPVMAANNLTITVDNAQTGQTYTLYKLFDATVNSTRAEQTDENDTSEVTTAGINYTLPTGKSLDTTSWTIGGNTVTTEPGTTWFTVDNGGNVKQVTDANVTTAEFRAWARAFGTQVGEAKTVQASDNGSITFTGLSDGYYFITSTMGSLVTVTSVAPNAIVKDKNTAPTLDKTEDVKTSNAGDTVTYTVEINIPANSSNVIFHDRLGEGLELQGTAPTSVTVGSADGTALNNSNYAVSYWGATKSNTDGSTKGDNVTITFNSNYLNSVSEEGQRIFIKYTAKLSGHYVNVPNEAYVSYGDNNTESTHRIVYESSFNFSVKKRDGDNSNAALNGAKFVLSTNGNLNNLTEANCTTNNENLIKFNSSGQYDTSGTTVLFTANNSVNFSGLNNDNTDTITYYLYEVTAPDGYNKLTAPVQIQIIPTFATDDTVSHGTHVESYIVQYKMPGDTNWTNAVDDSGNQATGVDVAHNINVDNHKGTVLPSTGGIGTTVFYVGGIALIAAAVIILVVRSRRNRDNYR